MTSHLSDTGRCEIVLDKARITCGGQLRRASACLFAGSRKRFFCEEKEGLVCGKGRRFVLVQKRTCLFGGTRRRGLCVQKRQDVGKESNPKVGTAPAFGSGLDYTNGAASAHTSTSTTPNRLEVYLRNLSHFIANERLRVPGQGFWPSGAVVRCSGLNL